MLAALFSFFDIFRQLHSECNGKLFKKMYDEINPTYNTIEEVPGYWRADIQELVDKGIISGSGNGKLGLTHSDCKAAVIAKRIREKL